MADDQRGSARRIAVVHGQLTHGGSERQLFLFLRECDRERVEPHLFVSGELGVWEEPIRALGVPVTLLHGSPVTKLRAFRREYRRRGLSGFVSWSSYTNVYGLALTGLGGQRVGSFRNAAFADLPARGRGVWTRLSLAGAAVFVCNSPETRDAVADGLRRNASAVYVPNAIEPLTGADAQRESWRTRLGLGAADVLVVGVGRLAPQKNFARFVDVVAELVRTRGDDAGHIYAVIAGPDLGEGEALARRITASGLPEDTVRVIGPVEDARELIAAADVFLLSSDFEGMPNVVLEAVSLGVPVVSTPVSTVAALLGGAGHIPGFGVRDLADAVYAVLADQPAARHAAAGARKDLLARRSPETVYRGLWRLILDGTYDGELSSAVAGDPSRRLLVGGRP